MYTKTDFGDTVNKTLNVFVDFKCVQMVINFKF